MPTSSYANNLPKLGNPNRLYLTANQENQMGEEFMNQLYAMGLILEDPIATEYLQNLGDKLVLVSQNPKDKFEFFFLKEPTINAFAGPGGHVGVNVGLFLKTDNESELAAVLAHELAHVTQGHLASQIAEMARMKKAGLASLAGIVVLGVISPAAATAALATTMAGTEQHFLNFSRSQEKEADRVGMRTLNKSGFNPESMVGFFKKLQREESVYDPVPELLRSHPLTEDRIADAEHRLPTLKTPSQNNPLIYYLVKTRLQLFMATDPHNTLVYFEKNLQNEKYKNKEAMEYGYGITLLATQQPQKGLAILESLAKKYPDNLIFQLAYAQAATTNENNVLALDILKNLIKHHPNNYSVVVALGQVLVENQRPAEAVELLQRYILQNPDKEKPYGILSRAQAENGQHAQAYQTRANYYLSYGAYQQALEQLHIALQLPNNTDAIHERLKAKIAALEAEVKNMQS